MRQRYISPTLIALVCGCLGLAACGAGSSAAKPTATGTGDSILAQARAASPKAAAYVVDSTTVASSATAEINEDVTYTTQPKRAHVIITTTTGGQTTVEETISDDQNDYVKTNGQWTKSPASAPVDIESLDIAKTLLASAQHVTLKGSDTVNGIPTYHLVAAAASFGGGASDTTTKGTVNIWVRQDNKYLVKAVAQSTDTSSSGTVSIVYSAWDDQVTITLPDV
jgi:hypothetical protein